MDRTAFRNALHHVGLTTGEFADLVAVNTKTVYDWGGRLPVPRNIRLILMLLQERGGAHGLGGRPPADRLPLVKRLCAPPVGDDVSAGGRS
jgi:hypothetical protein